MLDQRRRRNREGGAPSLDVTPYMNLMVVLIPFLLSGVVFSRLAVLDLNLPTTQSSAPVALEEKELFRLIVTLRKSELTVLGSGIGTVKLPSKNEKYDFEQLDALLKKMKTIYPKEVSAILLSEPDINYESLIAVMDRLRKNEEAVLFPEISIGEVKAP